MANNYAQFAVAIGGVTKEEIDWFTNMLSTPITSRHIYNDDFTIAQIDENRHRVYDVYGPENAACGSYRYGDEYWPEFQWSNGVDVLHLFADESFSVDHVIMAIQAFLVEWRPDRFVTFMWADTCSKPRIDAFGGGSVVVTAKDYKIKSTYKQISKWYDEYTAKGLVIYANSF